MLAPAKTEVQIVHRPIPIDHMECPDCFGTMWLEEKCKRCDDTGSIWALCLNGESGCTCDKCKATEAEMFAEWQTYRRYTPRPEEYRESMIDAGRGHLLREEER